MPETALAERPVSNGKEKRRGPPVEYQFKPGQVANPKGRPKGSRNKLGEAFIQALYEDFQKQGAVTIRRVRREKPEQWLKVVASIIPQEVHHTVEDYDDLDDATLRAEFLRAAGAIQARLDAQGGDRPAGAIEGSAREVPE